MTVHIRNHGCGDFACSGAKSSAEVDCHIRNRLVVHIGDGAFKAVDGIGDRTAGAARAADWNANRYGYIRSCNDLTRRLGDR
ncbi:hypothetical protein D3C87_2068420 [compost metagenome]